MKAVGRPCPSSAQNAAMERPRSSRPLGPLSCSHFLRTGLPAGPQSPFHGLCICSSLGLECFLPQTITWLNSSFHSLLHCKLIREIFPELLPGNHLLPPPGRARCPLWALSFQPCLLWVVIFWRPSLCHALDCEPRRAGLDSFTPSCVFSTTQHEPGTEQALESQGE